ncbi:hypothetical protein B7494_g6636 [Chlorociboria aeruginascens]|nr:hypothetical protein B7494_g6636 [Chlorociboria aeruginascens]
MKLLSILVVASAAAAAVAARGPNISSSLCEQLPSSLSIPNATVNFAQFVSAGTNLSLSQDYNLSSCGYVSQVVQNELCRVALEVQTSGRSGITLEVWLPSNWTGRFLSTGNGGLGGCIQYPDLAYAASLGFATVGANDGHNGTSGAIEAFTQELLLGKRSQSTGGRQGFKAVQSYPNDFDGVVVGAPALGFTDLTSWSAQFYTILGDPGDATFVPSPLWSVIHTEILNQCDGIDGVVDGIIEDPQLCQFRPEALQCSSGTSNSSTCLTGTQVHAVRDVFSDYYGLDGRMIFPRMQPGSELIAQFILYTSGQLQLSTDWFRYVVFNDSTWDPKTYDRLDAKVAHDQNPFNIQTWNGDLSDFKAVGGKFLITSDHSPIYYNHVSRTMNLPSSDLDDFYHFFRVSGTGHCGGGDGFSNQYLCLKYDLTYPGAHMIGQAGDETTSLDPQNNILMRMVDWVENGHAPETITGTKYVNPDAMPPFRDEHILIIAPGSKTSLAQLGLPESFTPPSNRFPTRMFLSPDEKTFEPYRVKSRKKAMIDGNVEIDGSAVAKEEGEGEEEEEEEEEELIEDPEDDEGAIYPLKEGRIENMPAFCAFLQFVHSTLSPTLHTPVMLIAQPAWTAKNHEDLTQFIFEKFKTPALCIMDSALATSYAFGIPNATVIDVGFEKVDITAITDFQISTRGNVPNSGGEGMTRRLWELLKPKGFTRDMAEQLKKSAVCEILPPGTPLPGSDEPEETVSNPAAAASTGATASGPDVKITEAPRGPGPNTEVGEEETATNDESMVQDGVLDVAKILLEGKEKEIISKRDKDKESKDKEKAIRKAERAEKAAAEAAAAKPKLPNSKKARNTFHYDEKVPEEEAAKKQPTPEPMSATKGPEESALSSDEQRASQEEPTAPIENDATRKEQIKNARREEKRKAENPGYVRRSIEVGIERFQAASNGYLDNVADAIYRTILSIDDISKRQDAWDALVLVGSGSKVRGFKEALIATLNNRYLVSPSSATMFTSELPSNLATPSGTGSMTPNASFSSTPHPIPSASAVNPLLLAATTASNPALNPNLSITSFNGQNTHMHSSHSQTPTSIKVATPPAYFPEWKSYEEAVFLGSQVAAKVVFVVDQGVSKGFLSRVEFNEEGPSAIHQVGLVY